MAEPGATGGGPAPDRPPRWQLLWSDLVVAFVTYVTAFLVTGLWLGGNTAGDVAAANVGAAVATALMLGGLVVGRALKP